MARSTNIPEGSGTQTQRANPSWLERITTQKNPAPKASSQVQGEIDNVLSAMDADKPSSIFGKAWHAAAVDRRAGNLYFKDGSYQALKAALDTMRSAEDSTDMKFPQFAADLTYLRTHGKTVRIKQEDTLRPEIIHGLISKKESNPHVSKKMGLYDDTIEVRSLEQHGPRALLTGAIALVHVYADEVRSRGPKVVAKPSREQTASDEDTRTEGAPAAEAGMQREPLAPLPVTSFSRGPAYPAGRSSGITPPPTQESTSRTI